MRLLNAKTKALESFYSDIPPYAILSHTWEEEEVTFQDIEPSRLLSVGSKLKGYAKIEGCCRQAMQDGYDWVWIDTCCIDKTSSAELSEAINSMYRWYEAAEVCYVYMVDVDISTEQIYDLQYRLGNWETVKTLFLASRWFIRGWTLQELIAPSEIQFYSSRWNEIGTKFSLCDSLSEKTTIPKPVLTKERSPRNFFGGRTYEVGF